MNFGKPGYDQKLKKILYLRTWIRKHIEMCSYLYNLKYPIDQDTTNILAIVRVPKSNIHYN